MLSMSAPVHVRAPVGVQAPVQVTAPIGVQSPIRVDAPVQVPVDCGSFGRVMAVGAVGGLVLPFAWVHFGFWTVAASVSVATFAWGSSTDANTGQSTAPSSGHQFPGDARTEGDAQPNASVAASSNVGALTVDLSPQSGDDAQAVARAEPTSQPVEACMQEDASITASLGVTRELAEAQNDPLMREAVNRALHRARAKPPPRIVVIGKRGVGKSTLVNSLRRLKPSDLGAARVGADEVLTTDQRSEQGAVFTYAGMRLQDLPGCEGSLVQQQMGDEYIEHFKLHEADACLFMYVGVLEPRMLACALKLHKLHDVPVFIVRNKVGADCRSEVEDGNAGSLQEAFEKIKQRAMEQIKVEPQYAEVFANDKHLFLIEAKYRDAVDVQPTHAFQKEFHRLKDELRQGIRDEANRAQIRAILSGDATALAKARAKECRELVSTFVWCAVSAGAVPIPGVSEVGTLGIASFAFKVFVEKFRLTSADLVGSASELLNVAAWLGTFIGNRLPAMLATAFAADTAADGLLLIPVVGVVVSAVGGAALSGMFMHRFCTSLIDRLQQAAEQFYLMQFSREVNAQNFQAAVEQLFDEQPQT